MEIDRFSSNSTRHNWISIGIPTNEYLQQYAQVATQCNNTFSSTIAVLLRKSSVLRPRPLSPLEEPLVQLRELERSRENCYAMQ